MSELQKARIVKVNKNGDPMSSFTCMYNPSSIRYNRSTKWKWQPLPKKVLPAVAFQGGGTAKMTVELLFDTTMDLTGPNGLSVTARQDVRDFTNFLLSLVELDPDAPNDRPRPPYCRLEWGEPYFTKGVVSSVDLTYTLFLSNGTPVRAKANVTFEEFETEGEIDDQPQNPTSHSEARKIWVVEEGQTLDWIAYQEYDDPAMWRHIAETNNLADPRELHPGQVLKLVPLP
jgi:hypothetical protein